MDVLQLPCSPPSPGEELVAPIPLWPMWDLSAAFGVHRGGLCSVLRGETGAWDTFWGDGIWDGSSTAVPAGEMWEFVVVHGDGSKSGLAPAEAELCQGGAESLS